MLLRASGEATGQAVDVSAVAGANAETSGVKHAAELIALCEAALGGSAPERAQARHAVRQTLGDEALVDACAVIGNFQRMVRIADGTGIPLDAPVLMISDDFREAIGIDAYGSASHTTPLTGLAKFSAPLLRRASRYIFPLLGKLVMRSQAKD